MNSLPIDSILPQLRSEVDKNRNVILSAEPGAGKTTRIPVSLMDAQWLDGKKILMLEPRRIAAQRAAAFMAQQLGEKPGETIGYRIRGDNRIGKKTRVEVVTEGILTRMIQEDPALPNVGLIIFDEFHERSIHADLGLALALDVQEHLRNDLRILIMSATLDGISLSTFLGNAPVLQSEGRVFPVDTHYLQKHYEGQIERLVVKTILAAVRDGVGDLLVFLPGQREIRRVEAILIENEIPANIIVHSLFGEASPEKQQAALNPDPKGKRKIILSTSIAETSVTIDGVRIVIDSGLARTVRFDPRRGMSGLSTTSVSRAAADQRRGRAGRQQPGICYRLWTEHEHELLQKFSQPEILVTDLAPLVMEFAQWGNADGTDLKFIDVPPDAHLSQAHDLLRRLGALTENGKITAHGKAMAHLGVHPRLAHMLIKGKELGFGALACDVAALLEERDLLRGTNDNDIDLFSRWHVLRKGGSRDSFSRDRAMKQSMRLRELLGVNEKNLQEDKLGLLLALAYPERIGKRRDSKGEKYQMSGGMVASLPSKSLLSREEYLAIGDVDGAGSEVRIFLASPLTGEDIMTAFSDQIEKIDEVRWDEREKNVIARRMTTFGSIELSVSSLRATSEQILDAMIVGIRQTGLNALPCNDGSISLRTRSEWVRKNSIGGDDWTDLSDEHLLRTLEQWLGPYLNGISKYSQLQKLDLNVILRALFTFKQLQELERLAPTHLVVPTGSRILIDYSNDAQPVLAVRLQEMFGETDTPAVGGGKVKVLLHLLSPGRSPIAVTQDLPSFWKNAYIDVRKDMRGQYPKHFWPENPLEAEPTKRTKKYIKQKE